MMFNINAGNRDNCGNWDNPPQFSDNIGKPCWNICCSVVRKDSSHIGVQNAARTLVGQLIAVLFVVAFNDTISRTVIEWRNNSRVSRQINRTAPGILIVRIFIALAQSNVIRSCTF